METKIKLGATLSFDTEKEKDIIEQMNILRERHKLGEFISNVLRAAIDNPELVNQAGVSMKDYGISHTRQAFFNEVIKEVKEMSGKIDKIYDMALKMYSLTQFNKTIGLEQKSVNMLQTQFVLQKQVNELCNTLGISTLGHTFESNKMYNVSKNVDEIMEFIINYYDGIVGEIKDVAVKEVHTVEQAQHENRDSDIKENEVSADNSKSTKVVDINNKEEDEVIDFGESADMGALLNFLG